MPLSPNDQDRDNTESHWDCLWMSVMCWLKISLLSIFVARYLKLLTSSTVLLWVEVGIKPGGLWRVNDQFLHFVHVHLQKIVIAPLCEIRN